MRPLLAPFSSFPSQSRKSRGLIRPVFVSLLALVGGLAGGCATGDFTMVVPIAGGEKAHVPLNKNGVPMTEEGDITITVATIQLNDDKKPIYNFGFKDSRHRPLAKVVVEDVSDEPVLTLVDDSAPKTTATGEWKTSTEAMDMSSVRLHWLQTISNSTRVFRFTLTFGDGQTQKLLQGMQIGAPAKAGLRKLLGENY